MIAAYLRVSTDEQTTRLQRDAIAGFIARRAHRLYEDKASGATRTRPGLAQLMTDVRAGHVRHVVVWRFDRFARSTQHLLEALEEFRSRGVAFTSLTEGIDTGTAVGRMVYTFLAAIAEFERELIRERIVAGIAAARAEGTVLGRPRLEVSQEDCVRLAAEGLDVAEIAHQLDCSRATVRARLRGSKYARPRRAAWADSPSNSRGGSARQQ